METLGSRWFGFLLVVVYLEGCLSEQYTGPRILWTDVKYGKHHTHSRIVSLNGVGSEVMNGTAEFEVLRSEYNKINAALAFDYDDSLIFWSELVEGAIYKMSITSGDIDTIYANESNSITALTTDWISNKLYWTDANFEWIKVSDYNGTYHRTLIRNTFSPFGIVANPLTGHLYWSERDVAPRLRMASLAGENIQTIFRNFTLGQENFFRRPQGLAIDYAQNRLFWVDPTLPFREGKPSPLTDTSESGLNLLMSVYLHEDKVQLQSSCVVHSLQYRASYLDFDSEFFFLSGSMHKEVYIKPRNSYLRESRKMTLKQYNPLKVTVYDGHRQPNKTSQCNVNNGGCEQLCLNDPTGIRCLCSDGLATHTDGVTCIPHHPHVEMHNNYQLSTGAISGLVAGCLATFLILCLFVYCLRKRRKESRLSAVKKISMQLKWNTMSQSVKDGDDEDDNSATSGEESPRLQNTSEDSVDDGGNGSNSVQQHDGRNELPTK